MAGRISNYLRENVLGLLALFIALSAGAYAAGLPRDSVKSKQIKEDAVRKSELAASSVSGDEVIDDALTGADIRESTLEGSVGATGPQGATGPEGPATGPAGGDLDGTYPNPTLRVDQQLQRVGAGLPAEFVNGWHNAGQFDSTPSFDAPATYYIDRSGVVHLRGLVEGGTFPSTIFVLPVGYAPCGDSPGSPRVTDLTFPAASNNAIGQIRIGDDGDTTTKVVAVTGSDWISLDGIDWRSLGCTGVAGRP